MSQRQRRAISEARKGQRPSPETRAKLSQAQRARFERDGVSAETRARLSAAKRRYHRGRRPGRLRRLLSWRPW